MYERIENDNKDGAHEKLAVFTSPSARQRLIEDRVRRYETGFQSAMRVFICKETKSKRQSLSKKTQTLQMQEILLQPYSVRASCGLKQRKMSLLKTSSVL